MPTLVNCYFTIVIFLFLPALNSCLNSRGCFCFVKFLLFIYLVTKIIILLIIIGILKPDDNREWGDNICDNIKLLAYYSYIYNIALLCLTGLYFLFYLGSAVCSDYDDYDSEIDYDGD